MFLTQPFDKRMKTGGMLVQPPSVGLVSGNILRVLLKDGMRAFQLLVLCTKLVPFGLKFRTHHYAH